MSYLDPVTTYLFRPVAAVISKMADACLFSPRMFFQILGSVAMCGAGVCPNCYLRTVEAYHKFRRSGYGHTVGE